MFNTRRRQAFSLVELLVVISLVTILLTIAMPSLNKSRATAEAVVCMSNLRQMGVDTRNFQTDNNGRFPALFYSFQASQDGSFTVNMEPRTATESGWYKYSDLVSICPADETPSTAPLQGNDGVVRDLKMSYSYNVGSPLFGIVDYKIQQFASPSDYAIFFDGTMGPEVQGVYMDAADFAKHTAVERHPRGYNVAYQDGHVEVDLEIPMPSTEDLYAAASGNSVGAVAMTAGGGGGGADRKTDPAPGGPDDGGEADGDNDPAGGNDPVAEGDADPDPGSEGEADGGSEEEPEVAETPEEPAEEEDDVEFDITNNEVVVNEDFTASVQVLGTAISYGSYYNVPVTAMVSVDGAGEQPFGPFNAPVDGKVSGGESFEIEGEAGTRLAVTGRSWLKTSLYKSGNHNSHWYAYMTSSSQGGAICLRNGDAVPQVQGFLNQDSVLSYVSGYVSNGQIALEDNQAIYLFELGSSNPNSAAYDLQDLVVLITLAPAEAEAEGGAE